MTLAEVEAPRPVPWWEQWQGRLDWELDAFATCGMGHVVVEDPRDGALRLVIETNVLLEDGRSIRVEIVFPDSYPHQPIVTYAPDLHLARHQTPDGQLCLFARGVEDWTNQYSAALAVAERVPYLIRVVEAGGQALAESEVPQGEPTSAYFEVVTQGSVLIDDRISAFAPVAGDCGPMRIRLRSDNVEWIFQQDDQPPGLAILAEVSDLSGKHLVTRMPDEMGRHFPATVGTGRWVFLHDPPTDSPEALWEAALTASEPVKKWAHSAKETLFLGIAFPEEVAQGEIGVGWIFLVRRKPVLAGGRNARPRRGAALAGPSGPAFVRGLRLTDQALGARIPSLSPLRTKAVAVVGLGSLGAPLAIELAKARVGALTLVDRDFLDPGTLVRHPIGFSLAGVSKPAAVASAILNHNPEVRVTPLMLGMGRGPRQGANEESAQFEEHSSSADMLIGATAVHSVNEYLDSIGRRLSIPRLYMWSQSGFGGVVALLENGKTGCYHCLRQLESDRAAEGQPLVELPADVDETTRVQAPGCAELTFTAIHPDLLPISNQAVRMGLGRLCGPEGGYGEHAAPVYAVQVRDSDGRPIAPRWTPVDLPPRPNCVVCGSD